VTNKEYSNLKRRLTRAINSGDPLKVLIECRNARRCFELSVWPDDWVRWRNAFDNALDELYEEMPWK